MSDSEFQDLAASTINVQLTKELKLKDEEIYQLKCMMKQLQQELGRVRQLESQCFLQLEKKNKLLKVMANDNVKLTKKVFVQEQQILALKKQLLEVQKSLQEAMTTHLAEKQDLLQVNKEFSENLIKNQQFMTVKLEEIQTLKKQIMQKTQLIKQMEIRLKEFWNNKCELQKLNKKLQETEKKLTGFEKMQKQFDQQKKKMKNQRQQLQKVMSELQKQNIELYENMKALQEEDSFLQEKIKKLEEQLFLKREKIKQFQGQNQRLLLGLKESVEKISSIGKQLQQSKQMSNFVKKELEVKSQQKDGLEKQLDALKCECLKINQQLIFAKNQTQNYIKTNHNFQQQLFKQKQTISLMKDQNNTLLSQLKNVQSAIQSINVNNQELNVRLLQRQDQIRKLSKINQQLANELNIMIQELDKRVQQQKKEQKIKQNKQIINNKEYFNKNNDDVKNLRKRINQLQRQNDQHIDTIEVIYKECQSLRQESTQLKSINQKLTLSNKQVTQTNQNLQNELQRIRKLLQHKEEQTATILKQFEQHLNEYNNNNTNQNECSIQFVIQKIKLIIKNIQQHVLACNLVYEEKEKIIFSQKNKLLKDIKLAILGKESLTHSLKNQKVKEKGNKVKGVIEKILSKQFHNQEESEQSYNKFKEFNPFSN